MILRRYYRHLRELNRLGKYNSVINEFNTYPGNLQRDSRYMDQLSYAKKKIEQFEQENFYKIEQNRKLPIYVSKIQSFARFVPNPLYYLIMSSIMLWVICSECDEYFDPIRISQKKSLIEPIDAPNTKLDEIKGVETIKQEISTLIQGLKQVDSLQKVGSQIPRGLLLTGGAGTGKTMLARGIAAESELPFFYVSGSELNDIYAGSGAHRLRSIFKKARSSAPSILFIDQLDAIGVQRQIDHDADFNQALSQLLNELDGFEEQENVFVIGATNDLESMDQALIRSGRFDTQLSMPYPNQKARQEIIDS